MTQPTMFRQDDSQLQALPIIVERQDGQCQTLEAEEVTVALGVLVNEPTRQAFPMVEPMARLILSLDGDYTEYDGDVYYYDDELGDPNANEEMVHGAALAACEAAEAGEYDEPEAVKANARLQLIAAGTGAGFLLIMTGTCMSMITGALERFTS